MSALTSSRVLMSKRIIGFQATDCHRWHVWAALSCFIHEKLTGFLICELQQCLRSVNHHQYLGQIKSNSKFTNLRFKKWLEIIASGDLPTKLRKSKNGGLKSNANSGEEGDNKKKWSSENLSNITLSNEEPLRHETPQQQENRLQISKRNR